MFNQGIAYVAQLSVSTICEKISWNASFYARIFVLLDESQFYLKNDACSSKETYTFKSAGGGTYNVKFQRA